MQLFRFRLALCAAILTFPVVACGDDSDASYSADSGGDVL